MDPKDMAEITALLDADTGGSKIGGAWPVKAPVLIEVTGMEYKKGEGDKRPVAFLQFTNLATKQSESRPLPDWFVQKLEKSELLKKGSRFACARYGMVKNKQGQDVHDFRAIGIPAEVIKKLNLG